MPDYFLLAIFSPAAMPLSLPSPMIWRALAAARNSYASASQDAIRDDSAQRITIMPPLFMPPVLLAALPLRESSLRRHAHANTPRAPFSHIYRLFCHYSFTTLFILRFSRYMLLLFRRAMPLCLTPERHFDAAVSCRLLLIHHINADVTPVTRAMRARCHHHMRARVPYERGERFTLSRCLRVRDGAPIFSARSARYYRRQFTPRFSCLTA